MSAGRGQHARGGFTLIEVCLAGTLTSLVLASAMGLFMAYQWAYRELGLEVEAQRRASGALARMVYGTGTLGVGLRSAGDVVVAAPGGGGVVGGGAGGGGGEGGWLAAARGGCGGECGGMV